MGGDNLSRARKRAMALRALAMVLLISLARAGSALALTFSVTPVRIFLSRSDRSQTLTVANESDRAINFQLSAFAWEQRPDGTMMLTATDDVIFFPVMLSLQPKQERKVRVGTVIPAGSTEKTYRLFVEELAPVTRTGAAEKASVRFLTKVGLPVFVQPSDQHSEGRVQGIALKNRVLSFEVANAGNVHFTIEKVIVNGFGQTSRPVFTRETQGWYVLAHGIRSYQLPIPQADCSKLGRIEVQVQTESGNFAGSLDTPPNGCGSGTSAPATHPRAN